MRSKTASSARFSSSMRMMSPCLMAVTRGPSTHWKGARAATAADVASAAAVRSASIRPAQCDSASSKKCVYIEEY